MLLVLLFLYGVICEADYLENSVRIMGGHMLNFLVAETGTRNLHFAPNRTQLYSVQVSDGRTSKTVKTYNFCHVHWYKSLVPETGTRG